MENSPIPIKNKRVDRVTKYRRVKRELNKICAVSSVREYESRDPRPFLWLDICGVRMRGLLDSGATMSVLGKGSIELLGRVKQNFCKLDTSITTADGTPNSVVGFVILPIEYRNRQAKIKFLIVPTLKEAMYLGIDFWLAFDILPNWISEVSFNSCDPKQHVLTPEQQKEVEAVKVSFPSYNKEGLGRTSLEEHVIDVGKSLPIKQRGYPMSPIKEQQMCEIIDRMLREDIIEISNSGWCSPVVLVEKSSGGKRLCLDSRKLNSVTEKDAYPLPLIDSLLSRLHETKFISSLDLKDAFWQVPLAKESRDKTAFSVPGRPLYQYKVMPFGLCNASQRLCRLMHKVIPYELHDQVFTYLDDLLIISSNFKDHIELLKKVAQRLREANLTINVEKSKFVLREIKYLGYLVGEEGLRPDPSKIQAIIEYPIPQSVKQVRRFLGLAAWYTRFISNYSDVSAPISSLTGKGKTFHWSPEAQAAFEELKNRMSSTPVLTNPDFDRKFHIHCDASTAGVGAVLFQYDDDNAEKPIAFMSKKLNAAQRNYNTTELECLAAVLAIKKFRHYIDGYEFELITDHASLKWLMGQKDLSGRLARWSLQLQSHKFTIRHVKGKDNVVADALSRVFCDTVEEMESCLPLLVDSLDLNSVEFNEDRYMKLRESVEGNAGAFANCKVQGNVIFIRIDPRDKDVVVDVPSWKIWVPENLRQSLLVEHHDDPLSSHGGIKKTLERIRRLHYWPKMAVDVEKYVKNCDICKLTKAPNCTLKPPLGSCTKIERPWQRINIDLMGPYPRSKSGKTMLLIIIDQLTKFVILKSLFSGKTSKIIEILKNDVFFTFGVPEYVHSDNGAQFTGKEFKQLVSEFGIKHSFTAYYSPQSNPSERVNRSILSAIRSYLHNKHKEWDLHLGEISNALRDGVHESLGCTPYFTLFGLNKINHGSVYSILREVECLGAGEIEPIVLNDKMALIHKEVRAKLIQAYDKYSKHYNLRTRPVHFYPGQKVFLRNFTQSDAAKGISAKLSDKFVKAIIKEKKGNVNYILTDENNKILGMYHAKDIRT